jgi:hypothetical protein
MKFTPTIISMFLALLIVFSGCTVIGDIFKTGVVFGILLVVIVIVIILYIINKSKS